MSHAPETTISAESAAQLIKMDRVLDEHYGAPEHILGNKRDPLDEAIYIILSLKTNLSRFTETWNTLTTRYQDWQHVLDADEHALAHTIREGGLQHQKARTLRAFLQCVKNRTGNLNLDYIRSKATPEAERCLVRLPGLSWKSARCILLYSLDRRVFPVDVNTFRILRRTGVLEEDSIYRRKSLHDAIQESVGPDRRRRLHVNLVLHGQQVCKPMTPNCMECPISILCVTGQKEMG